MSHIDTAAPCIMWTGTRDAKGYGMYRRPDNKKNTRAHRFIYEMMIGPVSEGLTIDHLCRVKACINPAHLEVVTHRTNIRRSLGHPDDGPVRRCIHDHDLTIEGYHRVGRSIPDCRACARLSYHLKKG